MRARIAIATSVMMALAVVLVPQSASAKGCGYENDATLQRVDVEAENENGDVNIVALGTFNQYVVDMGPGSHFALVQSPGDVDIIVCQGNNIQNDCQADNPAGMPDGCGTDGLEGWPGYGDAFDGPGTFKIQIRHCTNTACNYPADAPDLPYWIAWG